MNENADPAARRLEAVEASMNEFRNRLNRIEARLGLMPTPPADPAPPPVRTEVLGPAPEEPPVWTPSRPVPAPKFDFAAPQRDGVDAELKFGSVVLPRVGAGVMLLGIAYLVALSISKGWITPWMQFWGAIVLCLGFIGVGIWKRQEKFEFGQVLIGLGSCGLYVTFATGHGYQHLYSGEALIAQFLALSLANLVFGALSPSKTFFGIGMLGGLVTAMLPMPDSKVVVSLWLNAVIVAPTALILIRHKWRGMALGAWFVSTAALLWPALARGPWIAQLGVLYGCSTVLLFAYAWSHEDWEFDPQAAFIPFAALVTGILGFVVGKVGGASGAWHELVFGAALLAAAYLARDRSAGRALAFGGALAPFVFVPLGLARMEPAWTYMAMALLAGLVATRWIPKATQAFSAIGFGLGSLLYVAWAFELGRTLPMAEESLFLLLSLAVVVLGAWNLAALARENQMATFVASLLATPLVSRLSVVLMGQSTLGASVPLAVLTAVLALAAAGAIIGMRQKWVLMSVFSWLALAVGGAVYMYAWTENPFTRSVDVAVLVSMLAVILMSEGALGKTAGSAQTAGVLGAFAGWGVFTRLVMVLVAGPNDGLTASAAITLAWTLYATGLIVAGFLIEAKSLRLSGLTIFGVTLGKVLLYDLSALDPAARVGLLILLGSAMIGGGYWYVRRNEPTGKPPAVAA